MICWAKFKDFMDKFVRNNDALDQISKLLGCSEKLYDTSCIDEAVRLLEILCDDEEDGMISYWMWELDCGRKWHPGCVTYVNGNDIKLETVEDLYRYLMGDQEEKILFEIPSEIPSCPIFELTYHPNTDTYTMSMETIYQMDSAAASRYLTDIGEKFTEWMISNGYNTNRRLNLWEVFTYGLNFSSDFTSIEDAYAAFEMLVCGSCAQGIEGLSHEKE